MDPSHFFATCRLAIVAGKGGVGKTVVSGALARAGAACGLDVLVVEVDGRDALQHAFGGGPSHYAAREVLPRDDEALRPFAEFLQAGEPLCGRLQADKLDLLFGARAAEVQSSALLPLGTRGMLAIGSSDANRFYPGMGTLFLRLLSETLVAALSRYD